MLPASVYVTMLEPVLPETLPGGDANGRPLVGTLSDELGKQRVNITSWPALRLPFRVERESTAITLELFRAEKGRATDSFASTGAPFASIQVPVGLLFSRIGGGLGVQCWCALETTLDWRLGVSDGHVSALDAFDAATKRAADSYCPKIFIGLKPARGGHDASMHLDQSSALSPLPSSRPASRPRSPCWNPPSPRPKSDLGSPRSRDLTNPWDKGIPPFRSGVMERSGLRNGSVAPSAVSPLSCATPLNGSVSTRELVHSFVRQDQDNQQTKVLLHDTAEHKKIERLNQLREELQTEEIRLADARRRAGDVKLKDSVSVSSAWGLSPLPPADLARLPDAERAMVHRWQEVSLESQIFCCRDRLQCQEQVMTLHEFKSDNDRVRRQEEAAVFAHRSVAQENENMFRAQLSRMHDELREARASHHEIGNLEQRMASAEDAHAQEVWRFGETEQHLSRVAEADAEANRQHVLEAKGRADAYVASTIASSTTEMQRLHAELSDHRELFAQSQAAAVIHKASATQEATASASLLNEIHGLRSELSDHTGTIRNLEQRLASAEDAHAQELWRFGETEQHLCRVAEADAEANRQHVLEAKARADAHVASTTDSSNTEIQRLHAELSDHREMFAQSQAAEFVHKASATQEASVSASLLKEIQGLRSELSDHTGTIRDMKQSMQGHRATGEQSHETITRLEASHSAISEEHRDEVNIARELRGYSASEMQEAKKAVSATKAHLRKIDALERASAEAAQISQAKDATLLQTRHQAFDGVESHLALLQTEFDREREHHNWHGMHGSQLEGRIEELQERSEHQEMQIESAESFIRTLQTTEKNHERNSKAGEIHRREVLQHEADAARLQRENNDLSLRFESLQERAHASAVAESSAQAKMAENMSNSAPSRKKAQEDAQRWEHEVAELQQSLSTMRSTVGIETTAAREALRAKRSMRNELEEMDRQQAATQLTLRQELHEMGRRQSTAQQSVRQELDDARKQHEPTLRVMRHELEEATMREASAHRALSQSMEEVSQLEYLRRDPSPEPPAQSDVLTLQRQAPAASQAYIPPTQFLAAQGKGMSQQGVSEQLTPTMAVLHSKHFEATHVAFSSEVQVEQRFPGRSQSPVGNGDCSSPLASRTPGGQQDRSFASGASDHSEDDIDAVLPSTSIFAAVTRSSVTCRSRVPDTPPVPSSQQAPSPQHPAAQLQSSASPEQPNKSNSSNSSRMSKPTSQPGRPGGVIAQASTGAHAHSSVPFDQGHHVHSPRTSVTYTGNRHASSEAQQQASSSRLASSKATYHATARR